MEGKGSKAWICGDDRRTVRYCLDSPSASFRGIVNQLWYFCPEPGPIHSSASAARLSLKTTTIPPHAHTSMHSSTAKNEHIKRKPSQLLTSLGLD
ncbi:Os03g0859550 [Oryza sativa Japonica Group]|uniref:Os03g0859550 protein n=1 Tax=Oryza sativa subsp. japonica TaxID=39947 RepID=C7IZL8_ORYSJ|nr:Os03g0859550 [Oryza sativa Japonica Group]|eukprot:NP_001173724.1 Os03g0859550 [Oryza sativa Japonica Group]